MMPKLVNKCMNIDLGYHAHLPDHFYTLMLVLKVRYRLIFDVTVPLGAVIHACNGRELPACACVTVKMNCEKIIV